MMTFNNEMTLKMYLNQCLVKVVNIITKVIYEKLMDFIQIDIYDTYPKPALYERTGEFKDKAWAMQMATEMSNTIMSSINYFPYGLTYNPEKYQHGSKTQDRRKQLAEILNRGNWNWTDWDFGRPGKDTIDSAYPKPFWDDTIEWILENWDKEVIKAFKQVGLNVKKGK